eukprot:2810186-Pyramimonas_sp.AAC.1
MERYKKGQALVLQKRASARTKTCKTVGSSTKIKSMLHRLRMARMAPPPHIDPPPQLTPPCPPAIPL